MPLSATPPTATPLTATPPHGDRLIPANEGVAAVWRRTPINGSTQSSRAPR